MSPCLFNLHAEYIIRNAGLDESQARIKTAGRNINSLRNADDTLLMAEISQQLTSLLMRMKEESEKAGLKLNIQKTEIMAPGPKTSWQTDEEKWKQCQILFSWTPKSLQMVTTAMKLNLLTPSKKSYDQTRQCIRKQKHYFATNICLVKAMVFTSNHVWM